MKWKIQKRPCCAVDYYRFPWIVISPGTSGYWATDFQNAIDRFNYLRKSLKPWQIVGKCRHYLFREYCLECKNERSEFKKQLHEAIIG